MRKIPDSLFPDRKDFLRSLDLDPVVVLRGLVEHHEQLAAKFGRARWRPWPAVEPDPPWPPTQ
jgi:hypothetical protein